MKIRLLLSAAFVGCVFGANWALNRYGFVSAGFGLTVPAGAYFAGLSLGVRDALQEHGGHHWRLWVLGAIVVGAAASWWVSDGVTIPGGMTTIAVASGTAFLLAELADLAVYTPLRERNWVAAVIASNVVGAVIDSLVFLPLAFGSRDGWWQLVIAKLYLIPLGLVIVGAVRPARSTRLARVDHQCTAACWDQGCPG